MSDEGPSVETAQKVPTFMENWNARRLDRYREEFAQGQHDRECEQQVRSSLCHCSKRRREAAGKTELPMIEFAYPTCNGCNQEVDHNGDNFECHRCKVAWSRASDGDQADHFTDDYGDITGDREQFGERLRDVVSRPEGER